MRWLIWLHHDIIITACNIVAAWQMHDAVTALQGKCTQGSVWSGLSARIHSQGESPGFGTFLLFLACSFDPQSFASVLHLSACSWVKVDAPADLGFALADSQVHKMVMNIGNRPTINKGDEEPSVEVHTLHNFARDFYGQVSDSSPRNVLLIVRTSRGTC